MGERGEAEAVAQLLQAGLEIVGAPLLLAEGVGFAFSRAMARSSDAGAALGDEERHSFFPRRLRRRSHSGDALGAVGQEGEEDLVRDERGRLEEVLAVILE